MTCGVFRALGGGRVFVDQAVQNGFPADPFSIDAGHRGAASVTSIVRDADSGAQDRGASGPGMTTWYEPGEVRSAGLPGGLGEAGEVPAQRRLGHGRRTRRASGRDKEPSTYLAGMSSRTQARAGAAADTGLMSVSGDRRKSLRYRAWAVGSYTSTVTGLSHALIEHWDGHAWRLVPGPAIRGGTALMGVAAASPDSAWSGLVAETDVMIWPGFLLCLPAVCGEG